MIKVGDYVKVVEPNSKYYGQTCKVTFVYYNGSIETTECGVFHPCEVVLTPSQLEAAFEASDWEEVDPDYKEVEPAKVTFTAPTMLQRAADIMQERGKQYDSPEGERSMEQIVKAFNIITKNELTEAQGWLFMVLLKMVRDNARDKGHQDSCEDLIAYASLYGESRLS